MTAQSSRFGTILKNTRKAHNLTQAELAEMLDISLPYVKDLERSRCSPSYEMFERIIQYFNLSADEIFYPDQNTEDSTRKKIERLLTRCDEQQLLVILATVTALLSVNET
ncbi:XRE family transcriptional regulator [bacterium 1XD8-76]|nr:XRE family transcriptional regulator [bacterium 1XD8-76]